MHIRLPLNRWTLTGLVVAICSLVIWEWVALVKLADACEVWMPICWIPAMATSGVMLASTALHMTPELDERIRTYAGWLAAGGITAGIFGTGTQHYLEAAHVTPSPWVALPVGGIPVFMGGLLVHLLSMVFAQRRREQVAAEVAKRDAERLRLAEAERENQRRVGEVAAARLREAEVQHQRELTAEAQRKATALALATEETERQATAAERLRQATEQRAEVAREVLSRPRLVVDNVPKGKAKAATPSASVGQRAMGWLREQGEGFEQIGPAEIARKTGINPETCRKSHKRWKSELARERQVLADLKEAAG